MQRGKIALARAWWLGVTLFVAAVAYRYPAWNWDLVGYVACAVEYEEKDVRVIQQRTYEVLRADVGEDMYEKMRSKTPHRRVIATDSESFAQTMRFYRARVGYINAMRLLHATGLSLPRASVLLAIGGFLALSFITFVWLRRSWGEPYAALLVGAMLLTTWAVRAARLSTPDMLTASLLCTAMWAQRDRARLGLRDALLLFAIIVRTDALVFAWVAWGVDAVTARGSAWVRSAVMCTLSFAIYSLLGRWSDAYPYSTLFTHAFIERQAFPAETVSLFNLHNYVWAYGFGFNQFVEPREPHWSFTVLLEIGFVVFMVRRLSMQWRQFISPPLLIVILAGIARFVLWPAGESRFYFAYHFTLLAIVLDSIGTHWRQRAT